MNAPPVAAIAVPAALELAIANDKSFIGTIETPFTHSEGEVDDPPVHSYPVSMIRLKQSSVHSLAFPTSHFSCPTKIPSLQFSLQTVGSDSSQVKPVFGPRHESLQPPFPSSSQDSDPQKSPSPHIGSHGP